MKEIVLSKHNLLAIVVAVRIAKHMCPTDIELLHAAIDDDQEKGDKGRRSGLPHGTVKLIVVCKSEVVKFLIFFPGANDLLKTRAHADFIVKVSVDGLPSLTYMFAQDWSKMRRLEKVLPSQIKIRLGLSGK